MADIGKEIQDFQTAIYGEEVRGSMVSLAKKLNTELENNTKGVQQAINNTNHSAQNAENAARDAINAAAEARMGKAEALKAASEADAAADNASGVAAEMQRRLDAGEFTGPAGPPGIPGKDGAQGESGVMAPSSGMFFLKLDSATGNLYAVYPDGETPPQFRYEETTGNLYYVIPE